MIKVSVIVPVYNKEEYLEECLYSLIKQTLTPIEIIIVNDGSIDNSENIIKKFTINNENIKYISQENSGVSMARNKGIDNSAGEYIYFLDSDDVITPNTLESCYNMAKTQNADFVICGKADWQEGLQTPPCVWTGSIFVKKDLVEKYKINFPKNIWPCEDGLFSHFLFAVANKIAYNKNGGYIHREYESQCTNFSKNNPELFYKIIPQVLKILEDFYNKYDLWNKKAFHLAMFLQKEPFARFYNNSFSYTEQKFLYNTLLAFYDKHLRKRLREEDKNFYNKKFKNFINSKNFKIYFLKAGIQKLLFNTFSIRNEFSAFYKEKFIILFGFKIKIKRTKLQPKINEYLDNRQAGIKIGFFMNFSKFSLDKENRHNVIGDELLAESYCKYLRRLDGVQSAELYAPNYLPKEYLDIMIYLQPVEPLANGAKKNLLYIQNGFGTGTDYGVLINKYNYDGHIFFSKKLLNIYEKRGGRKGLFLPFAPDLEYFKPTPYDKKYDFDVTYIGNDIKGEERTTRYLLPATKFKLGLFGNWPDPFYDFKRRLFKLNFIKTIKVYFECKTTPEYKKVLYKHSLGKIPQEKVPVLYSSSKINLNFTMQDCVDCDTITLRVFEILACKGFCITDKTESAQKLLKECVVFTDGRQDLENKIEHYLEHPEERDKISQKGYEYVCSNINMSIQTEKLFNYLKEILNEETLLTK